MKMASFEKTKSDSNQAWFTDKIWDVCSYGHKSQIKV